MWHPEQLFLHRVPAQFIQPEALSNTGFRSRTQSLPQGSRILKRRCIMVFINVILELLCETLGMHKSTAGNAVPESLHSIIAGLPDPRVEQARFYRSEDILIISICAMLCGAESFEGMAMFGQTKEPWLRTFLELPHGIPSQDTFKCLLSALAPESFLEAFMRWTQSLRRAVADELVAIDGKALRRAIDAGQPTNPPRLETKPRIRPPRLLRNLPSHLSQRELPKGAHGNFTIKNINRPNNPNNLFMGIQDFAIKWLRAVQEKYGAVAPIREGVITSIRVSVVE